ncbi:GTPase [Marchantia polymorpha subsp. ruderalis]
MTTSSSLGLRSLSPISFLSHGNSRAISRPASWAPGMGFLKLGLSASCSRIKHTNSLRSRFAVSVVSPVAAAVSADGNDDGEDDEDEFSEEVLEKEAAKVAKAYSRSLLEQIREEDEAEASGGRKRRKPKVEVEEIEESRIPDNLLPKVAIVGRPNVGKSALFNRLAGGDVAIVHDEPGVTRDRLYTRAFWGEQEYMLVDTGGVLTVPSSGVTTTDGIAITTGGGSDAVVQALKEAAAAGLPALIEKQAAAAVEDADSIIFVVDGQTGPTSADIDIAQWLRKKHSDKRVTLAVNKCESPTKGLLQAAEFWSLGFTPIAVSAISGTGTGDLLDSVCLELTNPEVPDDIPEEERPLAISIIGRPNVGKSSILNALVGEERTIVSPVSGTTRDAIDMEFTGPDGQLFQLIDTAGIRRRTAVASAASRSEYLSINRAFRAIRRSDVVALVIDAMTCVTEQDFRLGERIEKEGKACVIVVNKWDTVPDKDSQSTYWYDIDVRERLRGLDWAPIVYTSATSGQRIQRILDAASDAGKERCRRLSTAVLNQVIQEALTLKQPPTSHGGKKGRVYFCTQAAIRPPTFVFFVNDAKLFPELYRRYMEKQLRANVGYPGTPIRLLWRSKKKTERPKPANAATRSKPAYSSRRYN